MAEQATDIQEKLYTIELRQREFTPEGESEPVGYYQLALGVDFQGDPEELVIKLDKKMYQLLKAADKKPKSFLDESQKNEG